MTRWLMRELLAAGLLIAALGSPAAFAQSNQNGSNQNGSNQNGNPQNVSVPEFDPTVAGAIAVAVAGGGVLLARRRKQG